MNVEKAKRALRVEAALRRRATHAANAAGVAERLRAEFLATVAPAISLAPDAIISGYWPVGEEPDVRPLMHQLHSRGHVMALPVVRGRGKPLEFRSWTPGDTLIPGVLGIPTPSEKAGTVSPAVLLVPLLAFDPRGYRLGHGTGYFDLTLHALRADAPTVAIGIAFAAQEVPAVPRESHDEPLDWVVTERGARAIGTADAHNPAGTRR